MWISSLTGCVSRYTPLVPARPLSDDCNDYARFSVSILKRRDQGLSKQAAINLSGLSVGREKDRELLYAKYKPIFEIAYADFLITSSGIRAAGKVFCVHNLTTSWLPLMNENYKNVAEVVHLCQRENDAEVDMEICILAKAQARLAPKLEKPPA